MHWLNAKTVGAVLRRRPLSSLAVALLPAVSTWAQTPGSGPARSPEFDVASVRAATLRVTPGRGVYHVGLRSDRAHGLFGCDYCSVQLLLSEAYGLKSDQIFGPGWLPEDSFHIEARMAPGASSEDLHQMIKNLLVTRFGLQAHQETRPLPAYFLTVGGSKVKLEMVEKPLQRYVTTLGEMDYNGISMSTFADLISSRIGARVIDKTGIEGLYHVKVRWENWPADKGPESEVFGAIKSQLGLVLKPGKVETAVLVVDKVNRTPTPN